MTLLIAIHTSWTVGIVLLAEGVNGRNGAQAASWLASLSRFSRVRSCCVFFQGARDYLAEGGGRPLSKQGKSGL